MKKFITIAFAALTVSAFAGLQTPINNATYIGNNGFNIPGATVNTNLSSAPIFTTVNNRYTGIALTITPAATNAETETITLLASLDNVNWVTPSSLGATLPNTIAVSTSNVLTSSTTATNIDVGAVPFWCVSGETNTVSTSTNVISLKVFTKNGGI
ncbi:MAG: hypothetical protein KGL39_33595 [Patescibacteria group bacterium]|nr:hypothetical protein [Patescibacteria group bacterium]